MDGNRRYARTHDMNVNAGHSKGFDKLFQLLFWCLELGIQEATVYTVSIENFRRAQYEIDGLMDLIESRFRSYIASLDLFKEYGIRIRVFGNTAYMPVSLQQAAAELTLVTKGHRNVYLNFAIGYTSRDEMCTAIGTLIAGANEGVVEPCDFSEALLSSAMYSRESPDTDFTLRTSGQVRLSDFLLWQSGFSVIEFIPVLWPALTVWQLFAAILQYQWQAPKIQKYATKKRGQDTLDESTIEIESKFDEFVERRRTQQLEDAFLGNTTQRLWTAT